MGKEHVLLVVFPAQGHITPALQLAFKLVAQSIHLTFLTCSSSSDAPFIAKPTAISGLNFAAFSQGNDDTDAKDYMHTLRKHGSRTVRDIIHSTTQGGHPPITRIVYTTLLPWAAEVAREFHLPSLLLWTQPVTTLVIFHYYFSGYEDAIKEVCNGGTDSTLQLPRLPLLSSRDLHSFMLPSNPFKGAIKTFKEHLEALDAEQNPTLLVNTYDALEEEALQAIPKYKTMGIGPLIPSSVFNTEETCQVSLVADLLQRKSKDCCHGWLNSKPEGSVIYVSFGSHVKRSKAQTEEIAKGLLASGHPFLWVITSNEEEEEAGENGKIIMEPNLLEEIQEKGMIVPWCAQLQVLKHPSVGCFMTHCGWNSTLESIACGVPMIGFPKMFDQGTIAKLIAHVWKVGVRVDADQDGIVRQKEINKCIESVMDADGSGQELKENARKFMYLGKKAAEEGGSSHNNFKAFVEDMTKGGSTTCN